MEVQCIHPTFQQNKPIALFNKFDGNSKKGSPKAAKNIVSTPKNKEKSHNS